MADKSTNTVAVPETVDAHVGNQVSVTRTSSSAQLLQEMRFLQDENKALKEQVLS